MAQYFTDFSEYPDGPTPSDFTVYDGSSPTVVTLAGGKKALRFPENGGESVVQWDVPGAVADTEIYLEAVHNSGTIDDSSIQSILRTQDASSLYGRYEGQLLDTNTARMWRLRTDDRSVSNSTLGLNNVPDVGIGDIYCILFQTIGTNQKLKVFRKADGEPANWTLETSDSEYTTTLGSWIGRFRDFCELDVLFLGAGTNGDPAPTEPVGGDTTVNPTEATSTSDAPNPAIASGASVTATTATSTSEALAPAASAGTSAAPTAAQSTSTTIDPTVSSGASASPTVALSNSNALDPQVTTDQSVLVEPTATLSVSVSPDPLISAGANIQPAAAASISAANDPVLGVGVAVQPTAAESVSEPLAPTVTSGASASPATVYSESAANDPVVSTAANVFPFTARSTGKSLDPLVSGGLDRYVVKKTINGVYYRELSIRGEYPRGAEIQGIFPRRLTLRS